MQTVLCGFTGYGHKLLGEFSPISGSANFWCQLYYHCQMKRQVKVNTIFLIPNFLTSCDVKLVHKVLEFAQTTATR